MAHEEWRDVVGYEGYYQVSDQGRVRSLNRTIPHPYGGTQEVTGRILRTTNGCPYVSVSLARDGKAKPTRVHRLVAMAFVPNPDNLPCVDHINGIKTDNRASNLRWCTHKQNTAYAAELGVIRYHPRTAEGAESYHRKRCKPIIRDDGKVYEHCAAAAEDLGVTYSAVMHVLRGLAETCKGYRFEYYTA